VAGATLTALPLSPALSADASTRLTLDIAPQSLEAALVELCKQGHMQLVIATDSLPAKTSGSLHGSMPLGVAFDQLLKDTGLTYKLAGDRTIAIVKATAPRQRSDPPQSPGIVGENSAGSPRRDHTTSGELATDNETRGETVVKHRSWMLRLAAALGICVTGSGGPACAQEVAAMGQLDEVVVTARKREESLDRVPVAVSVISQAQLRNNLTSDLTQVAELAPQVSMSQGGSGTGGVITVRGISSGSNDAGLDQSVAIEVDGIPISRGQILSASTFDLKQVQILEGPQALFFGKNSPAGVISLRSADPTNKLEAYATAGYEFEADERFTEAAISGPLTDTFKARLAVHASSMNGWLHNVATPLTDFIDPTVTDPGATQGNWGPDQRRYAGRLTLAWTPTEDFDAAFKLTLNSEKMNGGNGNSEPFCTGNTTQPVLLTAVPLPGADCQKNQVVAISADAPAYAVNFPYGNGGVPYFRSNFTLASLNLNQRFEGVTLTSTTGYYNQTVTQGDVSDWSPYATIYFAGRESYTLYTQELRANTDLSGPLNFMGGLYYEHFDRPFFNAPDLFHTFNPIAQNYTTTSMQSSSHGQYYSAFAQARWNIIPSLELAAGARYGHDQKRSSIQNIDNNPGFPGLYPSGQVLESNYSDSNVSPEVTLSWHPESDQTLYAAYKTGYKSGGISNAFLVYANATPQNVQFRPEKSRGGEIGYKATMLDRRLRFNLTAYHYNYDDLQVVSYDAQTINFSIGNAASARIQGVEGEFDWLALQDLTFLGNVGFNHARYQSYPNAQCFAGQTAAQGCNPATSEQDLSGKPLLRAPNLTYSLGAEYKLHFASHWSATFSLQGTWSDSYQTASDYSPGGFQDSYWLLNAAVRAAYDDKYEIAFLGRDLTNSYYTLNTVGWSGSSNPNQYAGFFNRPRELVLQVTARF
jgi:outer membrane receptor protein involved in Fe transport